MTSKVALIPKNQQEKSLKLLSIDNSFPKIARICVTKEATRNVEQPTTATATPNQQLTATTAAANEQLTTAAATTTAEQFAATAAATKQPSATTAEQFATAAVNSCGSWELF